MGTPKADGNDYEALIFGKASNSLCNGGDGAMQTCDIRGGSPGVSPGPSPGPAPSPSPSPSPTPFTCDKCQDNGFQPDACKCGVCGSFGLCTWSCVATAARPTCSKTMDTMVVIWNRRRHGVRIIARPCNRRYLNFT